jgi:hypothetical protein
MQDRAVTVGNVGNEPHIEASLRSIYAEDALAHSFVAVAVTRIGGARGVTRQPWRLIAELLRQSNLVSASA